MKQDTQPINLVIAEASPIVRCGLATLLKHLPSLHVNAIEATSPNGLENCLHTHTPSLLLVNPTFGGWFNIEQLKSDPVHNKLKCIAINSNIIDTSILQTYDASITLYDDVEQIEEKIKDALNLHQQEASDKEINLSEREKEIVICVVKGMTNKEIAEKLYLSPHTIMTHRKNIARKLEIHSTAGLTIYAIVNKLVELSDVKL